jgi:hypothetical protein
MGYVSVGSNLRIKFVLQISDAVDRESRHFVGRQVGVPHNAASPKYADRAWVGLYSGRFIFRLVL